MYFALLKKIDETRKRTNKQTNQIKKKDQSKSKQQATETISNKTNFVLPGNWELLFYMIILKLTIDRGSYQVQ